MTDSPPALGNWVILEFTMKPGSFSGLLLAIPCVVVALGSSACLRRRPPTTVSPNDSANSLESWQAAVQKSPTFENLTFLGLAYAKVGKHQESLAAFKRALEANPNGALAENNICAEHNALRQWDESIPHCRRALAIEPGNQLAKNNLGTAEKSKAADEGQVSEMRRNIDAGKDADGNRINLGNLYYQRGNYEQALALWREVSKTSTHYAVALNDLGSAYIMLKRFDEAKKALSEALRLEPDNSLFQNNLAWLKTEEVKVPGGNTR
jgi:tetratricopeptide (TPR) repeat protein